jgi:peptidylprolyl isomerase
MTKILKRWLKNSLLVVLLVTLSLGLSAAWWTPSSSAALPAGNAITDSKALLRYSLPIDNKAVRQLQASLEDIATQLRANRRWSAISTDLSKASLIVNDRAPQILESVPEEQNPKLKP